MKDVHLLDLEEEATHVTDEARMILPGVQTIMGFQLIAVFNDRFEALTRVEQATHIVAFFLVTLAMGLLMAPAAYHGLAERHRITRRFVDLSSGLLASAMIPLMLGLGLDSHILMRLAGATPLVSAIGGIAIVVLLSTLWFALPLRHRHGHRDR